jgi:predicted porin
MKKHLIAAAVAAAVAVPAAAQVTVYGNMDIGVAQENYKNVANTANAKQSVKDTGFNSAFSSSRIGFRGAEDLGGGLKAGFNLEYAVAPDTGATTVTSIRVSTVSLSGSFGTVAFGRNKTLVQTAAEAYDAGFANNALGTILWKSDTSGADSQTLATAGTERTSNAIFFTSPNFSGFTIQALYANSAQDDKDGALSSNLGQKDQGLRIDYKGGPLMATFARHQQKDRAANAANYDKDTVNIYGVSYAFGPATLYVAHHAAVGENTSRVEEEKHDTTNVGVRYAFGGGLTGWASAFNGDTETGTSSKTSSDRDGYQVGITKDMSKRTNVYALYGAIGRDTAGVNETASGVYFGINHRF